MIKLKCISTGSKGNMYILSYNEEQLIMELGVDYNTLLLNIDNINNVVGCTLSHEHGDHLVKGMDKKLKDIGLTVLSYNNTNIGHKYKLGSFDIIPLPAIHNVECRAFLIMVGGKTIMFATDTNILPKVNIPIDYFIVEVNYIEELRVKELEKSDIAYKHLTGIYYNHHSLENAVNYFNTLDYKPYGIYTIHKSNSGLFDETTTKKLLQPYCKTICVVHNKDTIILNK